jgi:pimeloyl-ACP methyl ester carboxylesterase
MIMKRKSGRRSRVCACAGIARRNFLRLSGAAVAGGLTDVPRAAAEDGKGRPTFVMIHGAWHGAWAFEWVANLLTNSGFRVFAQDLPGFELNAAFPFAAVSGAVRYFSGAGQSLGLCRKPKLLNSPLYGWCR